MITASMISDLRKTTGAGIAACKKALEHTEGDVEKAIDYLRTQSIGKISKMSVKQAIEGTVFSCMKEGYGALVEVNAETDFAARSTEYVTLVDFLRKIILDCEPDVLDDVLSLAEVQDALRATSSILGEKIILRRMVVFSLWQD